MERGSLRSETQPVELVPCWKDVVFSHRRQHPFHDGCAWLWDAIGIASAADFAGQPAVWDGQTPGPDTV